MRGELCAEWCRQGRWWLTCFWCSSTGASQAPSARLHHPLVPSTSADGAVAQDTTQARQMWHLREGITEGLRHRGARSGMHPSFLPMPWVAAPAMAWLAAFSQMLGAAAAM